MPNTIRLTRRVAFSSGHRYWLKSLTEEENRARFGKWASPYNHGHNYVLDVTTEGEADPNTGMVVNIKTIDDLVRTHVINRFEGRSINDEIGEFADTPPTIENLLLYFKAEFEKLPLESELVGLRLEEMPTFWGEIDKNRDWNMTLTKSYEFAAAHRLHSDHISEEENDRLYGKCANPFGHGHNYILEVTISGDLDSKTGAIVDLFKLDEVVNRLIVDRYDHKNFNHDLPEFTGKVTTTEIIVQQIWDSLNGNLPAKLEKVRLFETARNAFEVSAD
ncbi:MAG TPA: 6-carboxytetrahydropterin synthase [Fimbriimonadaceae bacterium]|jgi:6-pyruvoyltetrahydropterin/6-carboxytetrahydropterin synthase